MPHRTDETLDAVAGLAGELGRACTSTWPRDTERTAPPSGWPGPTTNGCSRTACIPVDDHGLSGHDRAQPAVEHEQRLRLRRPDRPKRWCWARRHRGQHAEEFGWLRPAARERRHRRRRHRVVVARRRMGPDAGRPRRPGHVELRLDRPVGRRLHHRCAADRGRGRRQSRTRRTASRPGDLVEEIRGLRCASRPRAATPASRSHPFSSRRPFSSTPALPPFPTPRSPCLSWLALEYPSDPVVSSDTFEEKEPDDRPARHLPARRPPHP